MHLSLWIHMASKADYGILTEHYLAESTPYQKHSLSEFHPSSNTFNVRMMSEGIAVVSVHCIRSSMGKKWTQICRKPWESGGHIPRSGTPNNSISKYNTLGYIT